MPEDEKPEEDTPQPANDTVSDNGGEVFLDKDIRIRFREPLPHFDKGIIKAYRALGSNKIATNLVALVCDKRYTPRRIASVKYAKIISPYLAKFVSSGKIFWPDEKQEKFCLVYENTLGQRLLGENQDPTLGWKSEDAMAKIVHPMIRILQDMRDKDIVHGEIWPGNMYRSGEGGGEIIKLGECLSAPASTNLPSLYEPVERAISQSVGRGTGGFSDDLYSFGVSLAVILRTTDPMQGMTEQQVIESKINKGTYSTLISGDRFSGAMLELLRGLLYDDPSQRWTLEDVQAWMDGRRLSPKQSTKRLKAGRPIILNNKKYIRPELLAIDMTDHVDESAKIVETGELEQWIDRAIEDKVIKSRLEQAMKAVGSYEQGSTYNHQLAAKVALTLYPDCPIRYKDLSFIPSGFGKILSWAYVLKHDMQPYVDVLRSSFVTEHLRMQKSTQAASLGSKFDSCRAFVIQTVVGSGLERCLYFLNAECSCLSPILEKYYVQTPEDMMEAFEAICHSSKPDILFDRHVVAFLSVKDRKSIDPYLGDLRSDEPHRRILGQVRTLATIQKRARLAKFPALADWIAENLDPFYERLHDKNARIEIKKIVDSIKIKGDISKIASLFDDPKLYQNDISSFFEAMEDYKRIETEKTELEEKLENKMEYGRETGQQIASVVSVVVALFIILVTTYVTFLKGA